MSRRTWPLDCKVYVGDLDPRASEREVEEPFAKIGPLKNVWVARNPPGFAFVEFEDPRDASDACRHLDGTRIGTTRVRVELSHRGDHLGTDPGRGHETVYEIGRGIALALPHHAAEPAPEPGLPLLLD